MVDVLELECDSQRIGVDFAVLDDHLAVGEHLDEGDVAPLETLDGGPVPVVVVDEVKVVEFDSLEFGELSVHGSEGDCCEIDILLASEHIVRVEGDLELGESRNI